MVGGGVPRCLTMCSNWAELCLAVVAVLKGHADVARATLIGTIVTNGLLVTGTCLLDHRPRGREMRYPVMMATLHARLTVTGVAFLLFPTILSQASDSERYPFSYSRFLTLSV